MIFADKLIALRKRAGWSQEELSQRLDVSRQSISKWEGAQSVPDLARILQLSELFGVTTDYLLKDEFGDELQLPPTDIGDKGEDTACGAYTREEEKPLRRVSLAEANAFLSMTRKYTPILASAVMMFILSPIPLLIMGGLTECTAFTLSEPFAGICGVVILLLIVAAAAVLCVGIGNAMEPYEYLEKEDIDTEYGVDGLARAFRGEHDAKYRSGIMIGVALCIVAALPSIFAGLLPESWGLSGVAVSLTLLLVALAVRLFVTVGEYREASDKLLECGDYTRMQKEKKRTSRLGDVSGIYWVLATAVYLGISFITGDWSRSWIVWPVAGVLYAAFAGVWEMIEARNRK